MANNLYDLEKDPLLERDLEQIAERSKVLHQIAEEILVMGGARENRFIALNKCIKEIGLLRCEVVSKLKNYDDIHN